jgi:hypothetical protein
MSNRQSQAPVAQVFLIRRLTLAEFVQGVVPEVALGER